MAPIRRESFPDELQCQQLVVKYFRALDAGDANDVAALFATDGIWKRGPNEIKGQAAIRAAVRERSLTILVRHQVTNIDVTVPGGETGFGKSYYALYRHEPTNDEAPPFAVPGPVRVGENIHRFVKEAGEWRIAFTQAVPLFVIAAKT